MQFAINLDGRFFCPFQIFHDIAEHFPENPFIFKDAAFSPICELESTNDWINLESLGKPVALRAKSIADELTLFLTDNMIELHINLQSGKLTVDNIYAILFLSSIKTVHLVLYISPENKSRTEQALGLFQRNINYKLITSKQIIEKDSFITTWEQLKTKRHERLQKAGFPFHENWLAANADFSEKSTWLLIAYAWACLKAGAGTIGCHILEEIIHTTPLPLFVYELLFLHLQLVRFLSHQYQSVADEQFPECFQSIQAKDINNLYFIKAYASTISRNLKIAEIYLMKCHINENMPIENESSLYQLNLYALFLVIKNEWDKAFNLEKRIEHYISENLLNSVGLKYVNFINIARLFRKEKRFEESINYYEKAYNEIDKAYTPSDHIYYHMNLGGVREAANDDQKALFHWMKAAIFWLAYDNPYALSWRPRLILCQEKMEHILTPLDINKVNQFLFEKIEKLMNINKIKLNCSINPIQFVLDDNHDLSSTSCHIYNGMILYGSKNPPTSRSNNLPKNTEKKLSSLISNLLHVLMPLSDTYPVIAIDTHYEKQYPESSEEARMIAALAQCSECYFENQSISLSLPDSILNKMEITLSSIIKQVKPAKNGIYLFYDRSFLNQKITQPDETDIIELLSQKKKIHYHDLQNNKSVLFNLIRKKILTINFQIA